jgi:hypothetical protein
MYVHRAFSKINIRNKIVEVATKKTQMRTLRDNSKRGDSVHTLPSKGESAVTSYFYMYSMLAAEAQLLQVSKFGLVKS